LFKKLQKPQQFPSGRFLFERAQEQIAKELLLDLLHGPKRRVAIQILAQVVALRLCEVPLMTHKTQQSPIPSTFRVVILPGVEKTLVDQPYDMESVGYDGGVATSAGKEMFIDTQHLRARLVRPLQGSAVWLRSLSHGRAESARPPDPLYLRQCSRGRSVYSVNDEEPISTLARSVR
jgi:hypothetical protein